MKPAKTNKIALLLGIALMGFMLVSSYAYADDATTTPPADTNTVVSATTTDITDSTSTPIIGEIGEATSTEVDVTAPDTNVKSDPATVYMYEADLDWTGPHPVEKLAASPDHVLEIVAPDHGEMLVRNKKYNIEWRPNVDLISGAHIELWKGGVFYRTIADPTNGGITGSSLLSYIWTLPSDLPVGNDYTIKVVAHTYINTDITDTTNPFTILADYNSLICLNLTHNMSSTNSSDAVTEGQVSALQSFLITYYRLHGVLASIDNSTGNVGYFGTKTEADLKGFQTHAGIPATGVTDTATLAKINGISCSNMSNVLVVSPNGGETWLKGSTTPITWLATSTLQSGNFDITLLPVNSSTVYTVASSTIFNSGVYNWVVGQVVGTSTAVPNGQYKIKICAAGTTDKCDESDNPFSIGQANGSSNVRPTAPVITYSSHAVNATSTNPNVVIKWSDSSDPDSGIAGYSYLWDHSSTTAIDETVDTSATTTTVSLSNGTWYFHVIAIDNEGATSTPTTVYGPIFLSFSTSTTPHWRGNLYNYNSTHPQMGLPLDATNTSPNRYGDPLSFHTTWTTDWYNDQYKIRDLSTPDLLFGDMWFPLDDLGIDPAGSGHNFYFGAHFATRATVTTEGDYAYRLKSDDDSWFYSDKVLQLDNSGLHAPVQKTGTIHLVPGHSYVLDVFSTERHVVDSYLDFEFTTPGVTLTPCDTVLCDDNNNSTNLVITNVQVANTTTSSFTVTWDTNLNADSLVVYGLTSVTTATSTLSNYGYTNSTAVYDATTKVVHHSVDLTGLSANTLYYFRVVSNATSSSAVSDEHTAQTNVDGGSCTSNCDNNPTNPPTNGGGCISGCGGGGSGYYYPPVPQVLGATTEPCSNYLTKYIKFGANNDPEQVRRLQALLQTLGYDVEVTGIYDQQSFDAVKAFQLRYSKDVLRPWGISGSTGYVFITTRLTLNQLYCGLTTGNNLDLRNYYGLPTAYAYHTPAVSYGETDMTSTSTATGTDIVVPIATSTAVVSTAAVAFLNFIKRSWWWLIILILLAILIANILRNRDDDENEDLNSPNPPVVPPRTETK